MARIISIAVIGILLAVSAVIRPWLGVHSSEATIGLTSAELPDSLVKSYVDRITPEQARSRGRTLLPTGWHLSPAPDLFATVGTMPEGIALSPDGHTLAVVESGRLSPGVRFLDASNLHEIRHIDLKGCFGTPVWLDNERVVVPGANLNAVVFASTTGLTALRSDGQNSWPVAVASHGDSIAAANDGDGSVTLNGVRVVVGPHPSAVGFSVDGRALYVAVRAANVVRVIDTKKKAITGSIAVGLHPSALTISKDGRRVFVAESDDDEVAVIDVPENKVEHQIEVGLSSQGLSGIGSSPNALVISGNTLFVSLGAANAIAVVRNDRLDGFIPAGWYPTSVAADRWGNLLVADGKGEGSRANPQFHPFDRIWHGYIANILYGSVRFVPARYYANLEMLTHAVVANAPKFVAKQPSSSIVRANGPIKHIIYVIKENRSYDQVLGDIAGANGDPALAEFGAEITPNQHAIARRFGILDNAYADGQVSADGHKWTDAAFANDYMERFWPSSYGNRRKEHDEPTSTTADAPHDGYLWDAASSTGITYRDYGEAVAVPLHKPMGPKLKQYPALSEHFDTHYVGWNLEYSDLDRFAEWNREFHAFVQQGDLPQLEIVYLPNDHTSGTAVGELTPFAYVATNDLAVGRLIDAVSHSRYWASTAIFALEDDAQDGPDHVSDQRTTVYVASPYAKKGTDHERVSTASVVHTIELMLGMQPLSTYDANARPLYDAFSTHATNSAPFDAMEPRVNIQARNTRNSYGAKISSTLDFRRPDAVDPRLMRNILINAERP